MEAQQTYRNPIPWNTMARSTCCWGWQPPWARQSVSPPTTFPAAQPLRSLPALSAAPSCVGFLVRAFAGVMADIALWLTVAVSALFLWAMWKSSGYDQATILAKFVACFGASMAFFSCLFGMLVALLIDNNWFGQAQRFRPNLVFGLFTGLVIPALFLLNEVLPMVRKSIGA